MHPLRRGFVRHAVVIVAASSARVWPPRVAKALPEECMNGVMEQRQAMGLDPFAPPCTNPDPDRDTPPVYPILMAKRAVENILENEENFRKLVRLSLPTGALQLPPEINPNVFERHAERCTDADAASLRAAARCYVRAAYDANELVEFAYRGRAQKRLSDEQVVEYLDGALTACRKCKDALGTIVALLPQEAIAQQGRPSSREMELEVEQRYGRGAMTTEASTMWDTKASTWNTITQRKPRMWPRTLEDAHGKRACA